MANPQSDNSQPDFFDYTDGALTGSIAQAIQQNDKNTLLQLLKKRKRNPYPLPADNRGWTALHVAASQPQYKDCLELLLKYGDSVLLDVNCRTFLSETALYLACENGCEESAEILLRNGCDPSKKTLHNDTPLLSATRKGSLKMFESLLNRTKNINQADYQGFTALHFSALHGHLEISRILLQKGANVQSKDMNHHLPVHAACENNHLDIARLLLEHDPSTVNCQNSNAITLLMFAVENCDIQFVRFLLEKGATADHCDKKGRLALHFAANRGDVEILQLILQYTDASCIDRCLSLIPDVLKTTRTLCSLTCCAIASKSVRCLEVLLSSELPKSILESPLVEQKNILGVIYSPLAYLFKTISIGDNLLDSYLQLLLKHKLTMVGEFFRTVPVEWPYRHLRFIHPFSYIIDRPLSEQQRYFNLLNANDVNIDYCVQCYHNNSQPFATFTNYELYYPRLLSTLFPREKGACDRRLEILKLIISNSVILEPDRVCLQFNPLQRRVSHVWPTTSEFLEDCRELFQYLISLKPVYFTQFQLPGPRNQTSWPRYPFPSIQEEFSKATLKQLCRTVIRHHLRDQTLEDNLRNFKRKVMGLPLPTSVKDYLLFKE